MSDLYFPLNFECLNKKCSEYKKIQKLYLWQSDLDKNILPKCNCKKQLNIKVVEDKSGNMGIPAIGKFSSMSREQKQQSLKQRSKDHFNKKLKEERKYMWETNKGLGKGFETT